MKNFNLNTKNSEEWFTPPELIKALGEFDLDPCSPVNRPWDTAKKHYTKEVDGLKQKWEGRVWLNPPYGKETFKWIERLAHHGDGIALIFARTDTKGFHEQIFAKADGIFFFKGRISFYNAEGRKGPANAPSCLVIFGMQNIYPVFKAMKEQLINGCLINNNGHWKES
ncbi:DNA N-6-adenine-methyltransferase [uncultured Parasutterella sp.]|uniref:DNA N-6-adenine-methyltransferase n=1 Tax=uncultured Parasutterella sp. TaxID=1263098 RepID=UPI002596485C|nr:DNA N-6-adenine-methyltransferase [uncultured Parasutterella sp.]